MFEIFKEPGHWSICLSASLENVDKASEEIKSFLLLTGIEKHLFHIILGMREALTNAVIHGSCFDCHKVISCSLRLKKDFLEMEIDDEGGGFDWRAFLTKKPDSSNEAGRGLAIMKKYFTDIEYNDKGNSLVLRKKIAQHIQRDGYLNCGIKV